MIFATDKRHPVTGKRHPDAAPPRLSRRTKELAMEKSTRPAESTYQSARNKTPNSCVRTVREKQLLYAFEYLQIRSDVYECWDKSLRI